MKKTTKKLTRKALVEKGVGIGFTAMRAILAGRDVEQTLAAVKKAFPKAHTTRANVLWYRSELTRRGIKVPSLAHKKEEKAPTKKRKVRGTIASLNIAAVHRPTENMRQA